MGKSKGRGLNIGGKSVMFAIRKGMYSAVKGIYENGMLTLLEPAPVEIRSGVLVIFLTETKASVSAVRQPGGLLRLSKLRGRTLVIPDDFNDPIDNLKGYI